VTAQRQPRAQSIGWEDIDGDLWRLPASFTKNGRAHDVPLGPLVLELLEGLRPVTGTETWVFESPRKRGEPIAQIRRFVREAAQESGVAFVTRDLRRTVATGLARIGISQLTVAKLLNHSIPGVTDRHYDRHTYEAEKRRAVLAWDAHLQALVNEEKVTSNLVAFVPASS
jgi:integrase